MEFVGEFVTWAARASSSRVTTLDHEAIDDAMEDDSVIEVARLHFAGLRIPIFLGSSGQSNEVGYSFWGLIGEKFNDDVTKIGVQCRCCHAKIPSYLDQC